MKKYLLLLVALVVSTMSFAQGTADNPAVLNENQTFTMPGSGSWSHYYFSYTCELTGTLKFSGGSMFDVGVDAAASYDNAYGHYDSSEYKYVQKIDVTEGQTYILDLYMYVGDQVTIELPRIIKDGDIEQPFSLNNGSIDLGADAGTVWATYTADAAGLVTFEGNAGIVTKIMVFSSLSNAKYYLSYGNNSADAVAESNTLAAEVEAGKTYYVAITKVSSPMGNNFSATYKEFEIGESKDKPYDITEAAQGNFEIQPGAKVWVKIAETAASEYKIATIETADAAVVKFGYYYTSYGNTYWQLNGTREGSVTTSIGSDWYACSHIICIENPTDAVITADIKVVEMEEGDAYSKPITLTLGETYTINKAGDRYYKYTFTGGETVAFELPEGATVTSSNFYGTKAVDGNKYIFSYDYNYGFVFVVSGAEVGSTFNFVEGQLPAGSTQNNPVTVENGVYTFGANTTNIWIEYTATETGSLKVTSDIPYSWNDNIRYYVNGNYKGYLNNGSVYEQIIDVTAGDKVQVNAQLSSAVEGKTITFAPFVPEEGEVPSTAFQVYNNDDIVVPAGKTLWYKFEATSTGNNVKFTTDNTSVTATLYNSLSDIEYNSYINVSFYDWGDGNGPVSTPYTAKGMNYLKVYNYQDAAVTLHISGDVTTFHEHVYATEWSYNSANHWHVCIGAENCSEVSDLAEHTFGTDRKCTVCGYAKPYEVTVADGTETAGYGFYPIYGYYADTQGIQCSSLYDESLLEDLKGKKITAIRYELSTNVADLTATFQFNIAQTDATSLSEVPAEVGELVYEGQVHFDGVYCTIPVDFTYEGGNLIITSTVKEAGNWSSTPWIGQTQDHNVSACSYTYAYPTFLPKTTFSYEGGEEEPATWTKTGYVMPIEEWGTDIFWTDACAQAVTVTGTEGSNVIEISQDSYGYHNVITVTANEDNSVESIVYNGVAQPSWGYFDFGSSYSQYLSLGYCYASADKDYGYVTLYGWFDDGYAKYVDIEWFDGAKEYAEAWLVATGINNANASNEKVGKFVKDGKIFIKKDGKTYNANGQLMK